MDNWTKLLEPPAAEAMGDNIHMTMLSQAISLKRIADALDKLTNIEGPENIVVKVIDKLARYPSNQYGEPLLDAIQNGIARGLRGVNSYD